MVNFYVRFLNCSANPTATIDTIVAHIDHIVQKAGIDHVCIGSDFDGVNGELPVVMTDVSRYPYLTARLLETGYSDEQVVKILGGNVLRVLRQAEVVASRLQQEFIHAVDTWIDYNFTKNGDV